MLVVVFVVVVFSVFRSFVRACWRSCVHSFISLPLVVVLDDNDVVAGFCCCCCWLFFEDKEGQVGIIM